MAGIMEGIGLPCMAVWALFGSSLRGVLTAPRGRLAFNLAMALALATTAVMMVRWVESGAEGSHVRTDPRFRRAAGRSDLRARHAAGAARAAAGGRASAV